MFLLSGEILIGSPDKLSASATLTVGKRRLLTVQVFSSGDGVTSHARSYVLVHLYWLQIVNYGQLTSVE